MVIGTTVVYSAFIKKTPFFTRTHFFDFVPEKVHLNLINSREFKSPVATCLYCLQKKLHKIIVNNFRMDSTLGDIRTGRVETIREPERGSVLRA